jgi:CheY-like chemotaxis protein
MKVILAVDDDEINMFLMSKFLSQEFMVVKAHSPTEFVKALDDVEFDMVLMDINLKNSEYNGTDLMKMAKQHPKHAAKPVIAVTAYAMVGDKEKFMAEGFDHYISKPFERDEIMSLIRQSMGVEKPQ